MKKFWLLDWGVISTPIILSLSSETRHNNFDRISPFHHYKFTIVNFHYRLKTYISKKDRKQTIWLKQIITKRPCPSYYSTHTQTVSATQAHLSYLCKPLLTSVLHSNRVRNQWGDTRVLERSDRAYWSAFGGRHVQIRQELPPEQSAAEPVARLRRWPHNQRLYQGKYCKQAARGDRDGRGPPLFDDTLPRLKKYVMGHKVLVVHWRTLLMAASANVRHLDKVKLQTLIMASYQHAWKAAQDKEDRYKWIHYFLNAQRIRGVELEVKVGCMWKLISLI